VGGLQKWVNKFWLEWSPKDRRAAKEALRALREGATTAFTKPLPEMSGRNAKSAIEHGERLTDAVASWVRKGMVAGPYSRAPLKGFRINPLMVVAQKGKVRPIMNLSGPKGRAYNEAVEECSLKKLTMSSARQFGDAIKAAGRGAVSAKYNISEAYKLIPAAKSQWRLLGFKWLGKWFYDKTTVFGSKAALSQFDCLPETLVNIACSISGFTESLGSPPA